MSLQQIYREKSTELFAQAIAGRGPLFTEVIGQRRWPDAAPSGPHPVAGLIEKHHAMLSARVPMLAEEDFETVRGVRLPVLRRPELFNFRLGAPATRLLLEEPSLRLWRKDVESIFDRSVWSPEARNYRTSGSGKDTYIEGADDDSFLALTSIAHELGHALVERGSVRSVPSTEENSEAFAHWIEEWIGLRVTLRRFSENVDRWLGYQRKIDAINLAYFGLESGHENPWSRSLRQWVMPDRDIFRESIFALPGYQSIYATATLCRNGVLPPVCGYTDPGLLGGLGLGDFKARASFTVSELAPALHWLRTHAEGCFEVWDRNTVQVIGLHGRTSPWQFASTTFDCPRGVTFLTPLARRYVPPHTAFSKSSVYALAENLLHESLHQRLFSLVEAGQFIARPARGEAGPLIAIPWRKTQWRFEHAVHALFVYSGLLELRREFSGKPNGELPISAVEGARAAALDLHQGLAPHFHLFGVKGRQWFQSRRL